MVEAKNYSKTTERQALYDTPQVDCETMRAGCPQLSDDDGYPGEYSYLAPATSADDG